MQDSAQQRYNGHRAGRVNLCACKVLTVTDALEQSACETSLLKDVDLLDATQVIVPWIDYSDCSSNDSNSNSSSSNDHSSNSSSSKHHSSSNNHSSSNGDSSGYSKSSSSSSASTTAHAHTPVMPDGCSVRYKTQQQLHAEAQVKSDARKRVLQRHAGKQILLEDLNEILQVL